MSNKWPYGTVVIDSDGETIMLLGHEEVLRGSQMAAGISLVWDNLGGYNTGNRRPVHLSLINEIDTDGRVRYKVQGDE